MLINSYAILEKQKKTLFRQNTQIWENVFMLFRKHQTGTATCDI